MTAYSYRRRCVLTCKLELIAFLSITEVMKLVICYFDKLSMQINDLDVSKSNEYIVCSSEIVPH